MNFPNPSTLWSNNEAQEKCTQCLAEFDFKTFKYTCRKCGLRFCKDCTQNRCIIPQTEMAPSASNGWFQTDILSSKDEFRKPQRVCFGCYYKLRDQQPDLRQNISRANQDTNIHQDPMLPNLPSGFDFYFEKEIHKSAIMVNNFKVTVDGQTIPRKLLDMAKGVVFLTIAKLGFVFTGRYGTGLVVAKLPGGGWSAPSALQMTGLGWGLQIGAELSTVMLILATDSAVNAFKSKSQLSVGAELGVSVGPVGRSLETDLSAGVEGTAHAFSYAQAKGLFVGVSLEASGIACRPDVNRCFYGEDVPISDLLEGKYAPPKGAEVLYNALNELIGTDEIEPISVSAMSERMTTGVNNMICSISDSLTKK